MKPIIYQLLPRLFTNYNETRRHGGSMQENGCGTLNGITSKALRVIRDLGATHVWYTGIIRHATAMYNTPSIVKGLADLLTVKSSRLPISEVQKLRLDFLFRQSFQLESILGKFLEPCPGSNLTTEEIYAFYVKAANNIGWHLIPKRKFEMQLPELMLSIFGLSRNRDIKRPHNNQTTNRSGYRNIKVKKLPQIV